MKKAIAIIVLGLFLITPSLGDDISEFEIEGMSIGDSLLDYMTEVEIKTAEQNSNKYGKYFLTIYYYYSPSGSKLYDFVQVTYKFNDKKYLIHAISGHLEFHNNIKACLEKKKEIENEISVLFEDAEKSYRKNNKHPYDKSGKSIFSTFDISLKSGGWASVVCTDWSEKIYNEIKWTDDLAINVRSAEFREFLNKYF